MPDITLYFANGACSLASHILLEETGIPYKAVRMHLTPHGVESVDGTVSHEAYRKIHHAGLVPALAVDGEVITESIAILGFIATLKSEKHWEGKTALERAKVYQWLSWTAGTLHGLAYGMMLRPDRVSVNSDDNPKIREKGRGVVHAAYTRIDKALVDRDFLVGDSDTLADFYLVPFWHWAGRNDIDMSPYPNYTRLVKRIEAKESAARALKNESVTPADR
uniref:Glutathione S-transferase n=1 Tax=Bionectria ochroleuca TaxID=29856 RepID=A0A8H7NMD2_BIOOC